MQGGVKVVGLKELRAELKKLDDAGLTDALKDANFKVADDIARKARSRAGGVSRQASSAASSLRASRAAARAQVMLGNASKPFALGAEFGSIAYRQFMAWRGSGEASGYFLWPTIRAERERTIEMYGDEIEKITRKAFPD